MSAKRLAVLVVSVVALVASAFAQVNELSLTGGRTFVSTQTVQVSGLPIHFANEPSVAGNYSRLLKTYKIFGLYGELPVAYYFPMDLNYRFNVVPSSVSALFVTPSARVNIFAGQGLTPWVSVGGGYGRFGESSTLVWGGTNTGPTSTNTGVVQFGVGLDAWVWHGWGARLEARDFYSGVPNLNVDTGRSRQHNYYVGVGFIRRF